MSNLRVSVFFDAKMSNLKMIVFLNAKNTEINYYN